MANETELKLSLPISAQRLLLRQSILRQAASRHTQQLINLYYDTPALDLHQRGIALRLRKQGHIWLQTVKCAGNSAGGLSTRPEWETPYPGHFDFSAIDAKAVRRWLERPRLRAHITPLFETNFRRTTWRFEPKPGCVLLLMLDRGWIAADGRREAISEVEIELASSEDPDNINELFKLAQTLGDRVPLVPAVLSKAERGYRNFQDRRFTPQKARAVPLLATYKPLTAFRQIAVECLEHLQRNHDGALNSDNPEFIHQMRVATRRLRAVLRIFAPCLPAGLIDEILPPLRILTNLLGRVRDFDVLLAEIVAPAMHAIHSGRDNPSLAALAAAVADRQCSARADAMRHLESIAYGRLLLHATALLHRLQFAAAGDTTEAIDETLVDFASTQLKRLRKKMLARAAAADTDDPTSLHRLRIAIKNMRYALEFFAPLPTEKPLQRLLIQLTRMQDELGQINDLANAGPLLMNCAGNDPRQREAVSLVGNWHVSRHRALQAHLLNHLEKLVRLRLPRLS